MDERYPTYGLATNAYSSIIGIKLYCEVFMSYIHVTQPAPFWNGIILQPCVRLD